MTIKNQTLEDISFINNMNPN